MLNNISDNNANINHGYAVLFGDLKWRVYLRLMLSWEEANGLLDKASVLGTEDWIIKNLCYLQVFSF